MYTSLSINTHIYIYIYTAPISLDIAKPRPAYTSQLRGYMLWVANI